MCVEKIIFVNSIDDIFKSEPERTSKFSFYCQNCGIYVEKFFYRLNIKRYLLCIKCLRAYTNSLKTEEEKQVALKKHEESCLNHFGTKYPIQNKNIKEKIRQTCLQKYGVSNPAKSKLVEKKREQTCLNKFGKNTFLTTNQGKEKTKNTNLKKFGVLSTNQSEKVKQKKKETFLRSYKEDNPFKSKKIQEKIKQTNLKKYGVGNFSQSYKARQTRRTIYTFDNQNFDSKPELAFYIWCKNQNLNIKKCTKRLKYIVKDKIHYYFPDFEINKQFFEIKGNQFLNKKTNTWQNPFDHSQDALYEAKHQCALQNNVKILYSEDCKKYLKYVEEKYGKNYLKQFKNKTSYNNKL